MNWRALIASAAGAVIGGAGAAVVQASRNKPMERGALIGASLGAILGASLSPKQASATQAPIKQLVLSGGNVSQTFAVGDMVKIAPPDGSSFTDFEASGDTDVLSGGTHGVFQVSKAGTEYISTNDSSGRLTALTVTAA